MKKIILIMLLTLTVVNSYGQTKEDSISSIQNNEKEFRIKEKINPIYKLFPTKNYWTFIKLDTRNGKMWQVHFTISSDGFEGELSLNSHSLVWDDQEEIGRFTLYPTNNIYNFILLDQINGNTYQVQWNNDKSSRFVSRIY